MNIKKSIMVGVVVMVAVCAWADTWKDPATGHEWTYRINGGTAEIISGSNNYGSHQPCISPVPTGVVTIPSTLGGKNVTSIGDYAFANCSGLTGVVMPDSVTSIGSAAFFCCRGLTSVTIPNSVTNISYTAFSSCSGRMSFVVEDDNVNYSSVNGLLLSKDGKTLISGVNGDVTIPNSVTCIGSYAFEYCSGLTSVTIPDSVTSIGSRAFSGCGGLTSVTIPNSVDRIDAFAFEGCSRLKGVYVADLAKWCAISFYNSSANPLYYAKNLFLNGSLVEDLKIPDGVKSIGSYAFYNCNLTSLLIPDSVISIGWDPFTGCSGLKQVVVPPCCSHKTMKSLFPASYFSITNVIISDSVTSIGDKVFYDCYGLTSVTIPDGVTSIGKDAFMFCTNLKSVNISDLAKWCAISFDNSSANPLCYAKNLLLNGSLVENLTIPGNVTSICRYAFYGFSGLTSVTIPHSVERIEFRAFYNCSGLTNVTIPDSVKSIGWAAFSGCSGLTNVMIGNGVTSIGDDAFEYCSGLMNVTIPDGVTSIGDCAFYGCSGLKSFVVASNNSCYKAVSGLLLTKDGKTLVSVPGGLTNVEIPDSVTSIGKCAFSGSSLTSVTMPDGVISIGNSAFSGCGGLTSVTIPVSVTSIGPYAFSGCSGLTNVYLPKEYSGSTSMFPGGAKIIRYKLNQTVVLDADGGQASPSSLVVKWRAAYGALPTPSRSGYSFMGWTYNGQSISNETIVSTLDDHTLVAQWEGKPYTVTFDANGGTGGKTVTQDCGTSLMAPTVLRTGYTFIGWLPSVPSTMPAGNATYTAQWTPKQYTVTFNANGGTVGTTSVVRDYSQPIGTLPTPTRTGHTFGGWWTAASGGAQIPASTTVTGNVTYYAHWTVNQYMVTFNANGGTGGWSKKQNYGSAIVAPTVTREWCTFAGWSPAVAATVPAQNVTYTAQWARWGDSISASKMGGKTMKQLYPSDYTRMTTVVIEEGITELPVGFFDGCNNVVNLTLPESLREFGIDDLPSKIRASLAYDANGFMIYGNWILDYQNRSASAVTIPEGIIGIGRGVFAAMYDLETVTMPESLRCIARGAFEDCSWIQNLQFMSGLRYVGPVAFSGCSSLLGASFADGVEILGTSVFENCWQMQSVRLPYTVTNIGVKAFTGCSAIRGVTVPTHLKTMQNLFPASYAQIETAEVAEGETTVMDDMFKGCVALRGGATQTDMSMIPNTVTNIGARAFQGCTSLTAFVVPDSVVQIGVSVFQGCTSLFNVTLSRSLAEIPDYAFYGCSLLETMVVPESVTYLGNRFFSGRTDPVPGIVIENALYYLCLNAPNYHSGAYAAIAGNMTTYVLQDSRSWDGRQGSRVLPQSWNGYDITYWTPLRFDVTFDANGGRFDSSGGSTWSEQQIKDMPYALPSTEPVRPGWAFEGWWDAQTGGAEVRYTTVVTATRTHTIYAHWRSLGNKMTATFNSNGGTVVTPGAQDYVPGQTFGQFPAPTRRGYTFQGWWTEAVNGIRMTEATQVPAADMELFAHWKPITYYVRFHANGGTGTMSDQPFTFDVSGALKTHAFTRTGFAFTGWATTPSGQVRYAENKTVVNLEEVDGHIVDLYAVWSGVGYSVRFDSNGGTGIMDNQTIAVGETQNLWPCAFARGGYTFAGWAVSPTDAEAKKVTYRDGQAVKNLATSNGATVPLYAVWVTGSQTVRITFDANGGSVAPNDYWDCVVGTAVEAFPTPTRPGFTFAGWWTAKTGGTQVSSIARVTSAQTFYAHWTENGGVVPGDNSVTVTFNGNGGSVTETQRTVASGAAVGELPKPKRTGYIFSGWWTAAEGGVKVDSLYVVNSSVTFYAHWISDAYIAIETEASYIAESDGSFALVLGDLVLSGSTPKITLKGLPTGLKYDAKTGIISGKATKPGVYKMTVSATNATVKKPVTAEFEIVVTNLTSEKLPGLEQGKDAYGVVMCGVALPMDLVDCTPEGGWSVKVAGLPSGLKFTAKDIMKKGSKTEVEIPANTIYGVATKAGTYTVTFTATKGKEKQTATITLNVEALPTWATGMFAGNVTGTRDARPYHGLATLTVAANGKISGKIALEGTNWTFSAASFSRAEESPLSEVGSPKSFIVEAEAKAGKATMPVVLRVGGIAGDGGHAGRVTLPNAVGEGTFGEGEMRLWRNVWKDKATAAEAKATIEEFVGVYAVSMEDGGYLSLTVGKDGNVKASGKLADGTSVSATSPLLYDDEAGWFVMLYAAPSVYKGGSFAAAVGFAAAVAGRPPYRLAPVLFTPQWTSRNLQATGEYGAGFSREVDFTGAFYDKAKKLSDHYNALRFSAEQPTLDGVEPQNGGDVEITFDAKGKPVIDKASGLTLSFAQATGIFKGGYTFVFDAKTKKKVSFEGILVPGADSMRGFYLWDASSSYDDPKTGKQKAYKFKSSYGVSLTP